MRPVTKIYKLFDYSEPVQTHNKEQIKVHYSITGSLKRGMYLWPVDSPYKGLATREAFQYNLVLKNLC